MDSFTNNCRGLLIRTFSLGPMDTKLDPFWCFFLMAKGEILISIDTDGFLDPKLFFLMAEGEILISVDKMDSLTQNCGG